MFGARTMPGRATAAMRNPALIGFVKQTVLTAEVDFSRSVFFPFTALFVKEFYHNIFFLRVRHNQIASIVLKPGKTKEGKTEGKTGLTYKCNLHILAPQKKRSLDKLLPDVRKLL